MSFIGICLLFQQWWQPSVWQAMWELLGNTHLLSNVMLVKWFTKNLVVNCFKEHCTVFYYLQLCAVFNGNHYAKSWKNFSTDYYMVFWSDLLVRRENGFMSFPTTLVPCVYELISAIIWIVFVNFICAALHP